MTDVSPSKNPKLQSRTRLAPDERERQIVEAAVTFFAEQGLNGQLRNLADRVGISHPLLYRYFPTKEALIARVYEEFYALKWRSDWDVLLRNQSLPLVDRLFAFYQAYISSLDTESWLRIFAFAGLQGERESRLYMTSIRRRVIKPIAEELCLTRIFALGLNRCDPHPTARDMDLSWGLHGQMCFIPLRGRVFGSNSPKLSEQSLRQILAEFLGG